MRGEVNRIYDAETAFRAPGSAAMTASGVVGTVALDKLDTSMGAQKNKLGAQEYEIVIVVSALDETTGDETYTFTAEVGATGAAATKVGEVVVNETGQFIMKLDAQTIEHLDANREELELNLAVAGTTPSITFSSWVV